MTEYETELIRVLDQVGNPDWLGIVISIVVPIVSALVVFFLSKYQIDIQSKRQYILDVQKENRALATKIKLDKYEDLFSQLTDFNYIVTHTFLNIIYYNNHKSISLEQAQKNSISFQLSIDPKITKIEVLSAYHPEIREDWVYLLSLYRELEEIIYGGFTFPNGPNVVPMDFSFSHLDNKYKLFDLKSKNICETLTTSILEKVKDLETPLETPLESVLDINFLSKCKNKKNNIIVTLILFYRKSKYFLSKNS